MAKNNITKKQGEIIRNLDELISKYGLQGQLSSKMVIDWVWTAQGDSAMEASNAYNKKCFRFFRQVKELDEMNRILQIFVEVWNFFPHQALGGKSPNQRVKEVYDKDMETKRPRKKDDEPMPNVICGGREFTWDEYAAMMRECERAQKPFRAWIEKEVLPEYAKYLRELYKSEKVVEKHERVAGIFFERALHLGFVIFEQLHAKFTWNDFPVWWQTHVLDDDQTEDQVRNSLVILSAFLDEEYGRVLPSA